eukprot:8522097-Lingulodinium_polyedra.AAC.1
MRGGAPQPLSAEKRRTTRVAQPTIRPWARPSKCGALSAGARTPAPRAPRPTTPTRGLRRKAR